MFSNETLSSDFEGLPFVALDRINSTTCATRRRSTKSSERASAVTTRSSLKCLNILWPPPLLPFLLSIVVKNSARLATMHSPASPPRNKRTTAKRNNSGSDSGDVDLFYLIRPSSDDDCLFFL